MVWVGLLGFSHVSVRQQMSHYDFQPWGQEMDPRVFMTMLQGITLYWDGWAVTCRTTCALEALLTFWWQYVNELLLAVEWTLQRIENRILEIGRLLLISWSFRRPALVPRLLKKTEDLDRKSTRLNSSHANISYAVFCLKKKKMNYSP